MRKLSCLRCSVAMQFAGREKLQLGKTGWFLGDLPNLLAGALEVDLYVCTGCGRLEFFASEHDREPDQFHNRLLPEKECPACGLRIDFDYPKCPCCGHEFQ